MSILAKKTAFILPALFIIAAIAAMAALLLPVFQKEDTGHLRVSVVDAYTLAPLRSAYVACAETGGGMYCENGYALLSGVPAKKAIEAATYGEATLIAYADGYMPSILLRAHVYPGRAREGPTIYMFPTGSESEVSVTVFSEAPDEYLMEELASKHSP